MATQAQQGSPSGLPTIHPTTPLRLRHATGKKSRGKAALLVGHSGAHNLAILKPRPREASLLERTPEMAFALAIFSALAPEARDQVCRMIRVLGTTSPAVKELAERLPKGGA